MTAEDSEEKKSKSEAAETTKSHILTGNNTSPLPYQIMDILEHLSSNPKIVFKSQQRDEPELLPADKIKLAKDVYQRNPQTFLMRFGCYMEKEHLDDFARLSIADSDEEMHTMINEYKRKIKTRRQDVKNRRYAALQRLITEGEYFSEQEMMKRCPELYQELVGQHLSKEEIQMRDSYDVKNTTFSGILMHNMEQKEILEIMEKAEYQVVDEPGESNEKQSTGNYENATPDNLTNEDQKEDVYEEVPVSFRQQWGNFDNEQQACSSSKAKKKKIAAEPKAKEKSLQQLITADERELLRQEFISQMHEQFLSGQDSDFDYATVDDNTQYDDLKILNQDIEDKYFEESDNDEEEDIANIPKASDLNQMEQSESEDELDLFMSHLNKHHSLQK